MLLIFRVVPSVTVKMKQQNQLKHSGFGEGEPVLLYDRLELLKLDCLQKKSVKKVLYMKKYNVGDYICKQNTYV